MRPSLLCSLCFCLLAVPKVMSNPKPTTRKPWSFPLTARTFASHRLK